MAFCSFPPGAETEEGAAETYRREGALEDEEVARKGTDDSEDPEGMSEDDFLAVNMEEKETQTGNFQADMAVQATAGSRNAASQTGRRLQKINIEGKLHFHNQSGGRLTEGHNMGGDRHPDRN